VGVSLNAGEAEALAGHSDADALLDAVRDPWRDPVPVLLDGLVSENPAVRAQAALLLREVPSPRAAAPLADVLTGDPDAAVRAEAAETLGTLGGAGAAVPALVAATSDPNDLVRLCAAEALGNVGRSDKPVSDALVRLLDDDSSLVRVYAVEALGHLGDLDLVPLLQAKMPGDWPEVRVWYRYALHQLGEEFDFGDVQAVLRRGGATARIQAATVLRLVADDENEARVIAALRRALGRERHPGAREHLQRLLSDLGAAEEDEAGDEAGEDEAPRSVPGPPAAG
jgi:HEAT repeat protein